MIEQLAGGGIVVATKFDRGGDFPVLAIMQSRDPALLKRAVALVSRVAEQELKRQDLLVKPTLHAYRGLEFTQYGDAYYTVAGSAFLIANKEIAIQKALDLYINGSMESLAN